MKGDVTYKGHDKILRRDGHRLIRSLIISEIPAGHPTDAMLMSVLGIIKPVIGS